MSSIESYLVNRDPQLHLRDAQHAHRFYTENAHLFSPKVKFLYHVVFEITDGTVSHSYGKEIGVLAKSCDLPQYRINVDTRKQYNRNRNFQTGINYEEVKIVFHDDNYGVTSALMEDYYRYYYRDGNKNKGTPGDYIDYSRKTSYHYGEKLPRYGLDFEYSSQNRDHFFKKIIIYQMARQQWTSFTLVNPLVTALGHDTLDYSDGSGIMENTLSIAYEAVMYNRGNVGEDSEPAGFTAPETRYDVTPSPLVSSNPNANRRTSSLRQVADSLKNISETELAFGTSPNQDARGLFDNTPGVFNQLSVAQQFENEGSGVQGFVIPKTDTQNSSQLAPSISLRPIARPVSSASDTDGTVTAQFRANDIAAIEKFVAGNNGNVTIWLSAQTDDRSVADAEIAAIRAAKDTALASGRTEEDIVTRATAALPAGQIRFEVKND